MPHWPLPAQVREEYESRTAEVYAFTSAKKMASILIRRDDSTLRLYNKGAAEWVLKRCVSLHNEYGEVVPMTEAIREELMQVSRVLLSCVLQKFYFAYNTCQHRVAHFSTSDAGLGGWLCAASSEWQNICCGCAVSC